MCQLSRDRKVFVQHRKNRVLFVVFDSEVTLI